MTAVALQPYLYFGGRCEEAIEFYRGALGAHLEILMRFSESPDPTPPGMLPAGFEEKVMHATLRIGEAILMVSDGCSVDSPFHGFSLSLACSDEADIDRAFAALAEGGQVTMPPTKTFWSPRFAMVTDRFGVAWMLTIAPSA